MTDLEKMHRMLTISKEKMSTNLHNTKIRIETNLSDYPEFIMELLSSGVRVSAGSAEVNRPDIELHGKDVVDLFNTAINEINFPTPNVIEKYYMFDRKNI